MQASGGAADDASLGAGRRGLVVNAVAVVAAVAWRERPHADFPETKVE